MFTIGLNFGREDSDGVSLESWTHSAEYSFAFPELSGTQACDFPHVGNYGSFSNWWEPACRSIGYSDVSAFTVLPDYRGMQVCVVVLISRPIRHVSMRFLAHTNTSTIALRLFPVVAETGSGTSSRTLCLSRAALGVIPKSDT